MSQGRRQFTDEFKREAVALLVSSGRPLSRIASELGISPSMLRNWRNGSAGRDAGSARHTIPASAPHSAPDPASAARSISAPSRARVAVIEHCGHIPEMEKPGEFGRSVEDFLAG
jgi:transposase